MLANGKRQMFLIGPGFPMGDQQPWDMVRWFLASHALLLVPCLLLGVIVLAVYLRGALGRRVAERLQEASPGAPT